MNLKQLETFVRVAEMGSFSKAARVLDTVQPALSRQVRQLEIDLHMTLLDRTGRGVVLTEAGRRLFEHSVGILERVERAREDLAASRDEPVGRVVIGLPPSVGRQLTVPLVETFERSWPKARLAVVEGLSAHIGEWIATGRVDIGLLYNPEPQPALELTPLRTEPLCLISPAARCTPETPPTLTLAELHGVPLVIPERLHATRRLLEAQAALAGIKLRVAWEISSVASILALVRQGHGHAVLTREAVSGEHEARALVVRTIVQPTLSNALFAATAASRRATPLQRAVLDWLGQQLG